MKKTAKQLDAEIAAYLRYEKIGPRQFASMPKYNAKKGVWIGGDSRMLYTFSDPDTGRWMVRPGAGPTGKITDVGGRALVRVATKAEAEREWQNPLHAGWTVDP